MGLAFTGLLPLLRKRGECDRGETRTGHLQENLARDRATLFPGSSLRTRHCWGPWMGSRAPGPSADDRCTDDPNSEPGLLARRRVSGRASRHLDSTQPMLSPWINLLLPFPQEGEEQAGKPSVHHSLCPACRGRAQGAGEQRGSMTLASEPVQGWGERLSWLGSQGKISFLFNLGRVCLS